MERDAPLKANGVPEADGNQPSYLDVSQRPFYRANAVVANHDLSRCRAYQMHRLMAGYADAFDEWRDEADWAPNICAGCAIRYGAGAQVDARVWLDRHMDGEPLLSRLQRLDILERAGRRPEDRPARQGLRWPQGPNPNIPSGRLEEGEQRNQ